MFVRPPPGVRVVTALDHHWRVKAFIDESYDVGAGTGGFYVLAAVFARADEEDGIRSAMLAARARGQRRAHLRDEGDKRALLLAELVGALRLSPLVVLGSPL